VSNETKPALLPVQVTAALKKARALLVGLSRPARILLVSTLVSATALVSFLGYNSSHEPYAVLFSQLDQDDAAGVVAKLKELKLPYRLDTGGTTIEVPESRVGELRLELASAGMPRGGGVGFESFDKMRLGATEFEQRVLYRRALEGELARTIGTISAVQTARVHLVLPEKSVFVARAEPASASIVIRLRSGRTIGAPEVAGIVHLTAASVPGLTPDHIALVTTAGEMLKRPRAAGDGAGQEADDDRGSQERVVASELEERARAMLERVVGAGHVDVRVTAELDTARVEHTEDHYDPTKSTLRSEESTTERSAGTPDDSVAGVPGAESNMPPGAASATPPKKADPKAAEDGGARPVAALGGAQATDQPYRKSFTRNFEVDHVSDRRTIAPGTLKRIGVAVLVDGIARTENGQRTVIARDRAELDRFAALVRSAVGASDARGDMVTVDSAPFEESEAALEAAATPPPAAPALPFMKRWRAYLPAAAGAVVLLVLVVGASIVARRRNRATQVIAVESRVIPPTVDPAQLGPAKEEAPVDLRALAMERAASDPATAALVLRFWLGTSDTGVAKSAKA